MDTALVALLAGTSLALAAALVVVLVRLSADRAPARRGEAALAERAAGFEARVDGLGTQLDRLGSLVQQMERRSAHHHGQLAAGIEQVATTSQRLAETTGALREALASPKARGQWGERMADDVLRAAGMVEGVTHVKQTALPGGTIPDVTFLLPGGRRLHMDVKFPIDNYLRHLDAVTDAERAATAKAFCRDVRDRVKELAQRGYVDPDTTVDAVLLFIPNESVWGFVHEHDPQLLDVAMAQRVVLCSPVSLFGVLAVIRQAVEEAQLTRTTDEILRCLAGFRTQWAKYAEAVEAVERRFLSAQRGLEELAGPRRRQLERQLERLDDLRAARGLPVTGGADEDGDGDREARRRAEGDVRAWEASAG
jgi:DNA recombination protein RmuC